MRKHKDANTEFASGLSEVVGLQLQPAKSQCAALLRRNIDDTKPGINQNSVIMIDSNALHGTIASNVPIGSQQFVNSTHDQD